MTLNNVGIFTAGEISK